MWRAWHLLSVTRSFRAFSEKNYDSHEAGNVRRAIVPRYGIIMAYRVLMDLRDLIIKYSQTSWAD